MSFRPGGLRNPGRTQMKVGDPWAGSHSRAGSQGDLGGVPEGCTQTTWMSPLRFGLVLEPGGGGRDCSWEKSGLGQPDLQLEHTVPGTERSSCPALL